jgi:hypothetical protein
MSLRMVDFECRKCHRTYEEMCPSDAQSSQHCGVSATRVWVRAPGLAGVNPHFSHALGRRVSGYIEEDRELAKKGQWVATKKEASSMYDHDFMGDNVTIKPATKDAIKKQVEKQARRLASDGLISLPE